MRIGGIEKFSTIDFPGMLSCTIFLAGCNLNCLYCHNPQLITGQDPHACISGEDVMEFLKRRKGMLEGVCITGGEPTVTEELRDLIKDIKDLGYKVKLDTNGTNPDVLKELVAEGLLDYIAMDVKAPAGKYGDIVGREVDLGAIRKSMEYIQNCGIEYEFRTTYLPTLNKEDILEIARTIKGSKKYVLQQFRNKLTNDPEFAKNEPHMESYIRETAQEVNDQGQRCEVRGF